MVAHKVWGTSLVINYAGPFAWNALFDNNRFVAASVKFWKLLKSHYFTAAFNISLTATRF